MRLRLLPAAVLMLATTFASAQNPAAAAPTPPMGWNSWDAYGLTITEAQFRANVQVLHEKLQPFGWRYAVIDEGWFFFNPDDRPRPDTLHYSIDPHGRYVPVPARFPSAATGRPIADANMGAKPKLSATLEETSFKPLADWVHGQGLLFGIHIVRGIPRASVERNLPIANSDFHAQDAADTTDACGWDPTNWGVKDNTAGQAWYDSLIHQYAGWGVDLLKVDCIADHPYKVSEIRQIRRAIDKVQRETGHSMVLSLSPGPTNPSHAAEVASLSNMWRISNDFWDLWSGGNFADGFPQSLKGQFDRLAAWSKFDLKAGQWPDADMLPFGELRPSPGWGQPRRSRLTIEEERTVMTLWSMYRSPLILGANLTLLDPQTLALLTNREVIRMDQHGERAGQIEPPLEKYDDKLPQSISGLRVLSSGYPGGKRYAALFNTSDQPIQVTRTVADLDLVEGSHSPRAVQLVEVWTGKDLGRVDRVNLRIPPHGCVLLEQR